MTKIKLTPAEIRKARKIVSDITKLNIEFSSVVVLILRIIKIYKLPLEVFETRRSKLRQRYLFSLGHSKTLKGNHPKGLAIDIVHKEEVSPGKYKLSWKKHLIYDIFAFLVKHHVGENITNGKITWGGDWKNFYDPAHWEFKPKKYGG